MTTNILDSFGKALVEARDASIRSLDGGLVAARGGNNALWAKRWRDAERAGKLPEALIPECVDSALFYLLDAIDKGRLRLRFEDESGEEIDLGESQELAGWLIGESPDAWRQRFSKERLNWTPPKRARKKRKTREKK